MVCLGVLVVLGVHVRVLPCQVAARSLTMVVVGLEWNLVPILPGFIFF